jgi:hypothetical protein
MSGPPHSSRPPSRVVSWPAVAAALLIAGLFVVGLFVVLKYRLLNETGPAEVEAAQVEPDTASSAREEQKPPVLTPLQPVATAPPAAAPQTVASGPVPPGDGIHETQRIIGSGLFPPQESDYLLPAPPPPPPLLHPPATSPPPPTEPTPPRAPPAKPAEVPVVAPAPPAPNPPERRAADVAFEERAARDEEDLRKELLKVPELRPLSDLEVVALHNAEVPTPQVKVRPLGSRGPTFTSPPPHAALALKLQTDFRKAALKEGLPMQSGPQCQLPAPTAGIMQTLSSELRKMGFVSVPGLASSVVLPGRGAVQVRATGIRGGSAPEKIKAFKEWCDVNHVEKYRGALPTLIQMLQVEDVPTRLLLVKELEKVKGPATTAALASRAMMDLSPPVRQAAVEALQKRPSGHYLPLLLRGLRYPWPPVADHSAMALVRLKPPGAVPHLVDLLDKPDPSLPILDRTTRKPSVLELVRLNHMRNCLLCHAPSNGPQDGLVRAPVPTPGQRLPPAYYAERSGTLSVRADITFLRQDFSVCLEMPNDAPWPEEQRFDFVTRLRRLEPKEMPEVARGPSYPQRDAVLYTLRQLTGRDAGETSAKWRELLPIAAAPAGKQTNTPATTPPEAGRPTP